MSRISDICAVTRREFHQIASDRWTAMAMFVIPLIVGVVLAFIYQQRIVRDLPVLVVDLDQSSTSRALLRALDANESLAVTETASSTEGVEEQMRRGRVVCAVEIPQHFEQELKRGNPQQLLCFVNGSNVLVTNYALKGVTAVVGTVSAGVSMKGMEKRGIPSQHVLAAYSPVTISARYLFNPSQNYGNFFLPGVLGALLQQIVVVGAALTWVREFRTGQIRELLLITTRVTDLVMGKLLAYVAIGAAWSVVLFVGLFSLLDVPFTGSVAGGIVAVVLMLAAMALLAMLISSLVTHRETAMQVVFIVSSPAFLISGYTFPLLAMPTAMRWSAYLIPLTPFLTAWRRIVLYGASFADTWGQMLILLVMIAGFAVPMIHVIRRKVEVPS